MAEDDLAPTAIYVRASTELQRYSTENQLMALRQYASDKGLHVSALYEDDGRSGLTLRGRPELRRLLKDVLEIPRPFETILVYDISRWGRFQDADESAFYEHLCKRAGARVIYAFEPFENDNSAISNVLKAMKRAMAAEYSRELSKKVQIGQIRMAERGFWQGGIPGYGLRRVLVDVDGVERTTLRSGQRKWFLNDRIVIRAGAPQEVAVVRRMYRMFAVKHLALNAIAARLNAEGVPPPGRSSLWQGPTISKILRNERYIGAYVFNQTTMVLKSPRRRNPQADWVRTPGAIEATVPRWLFLKAQKRFGSYRALFGRRSDDALLGDLKALLERAGRLSCNLIKHEPSMATPETYAKRFGSLPNAYRRVGYGDCPDYTGIAQLNMQRGYSAEELVAKLQSLLDRRGRVTRALISAEPGMPSPATFARAFGNLTGAYRQLGLAAFPPGIRRKGADGSDMRNPNALRSGEEPPA